MLGKTCISQLSSHLFWDIDIEQANMDTCPSQIIQRVLEYGTLNDWYLIRSYYGLDKIVEVCLNLRSLAPVALSVISCISQKDKPLFRCYHTKPSMPTL